MEREWFRSAEKYRERRFTAVCRLAGTKGLTQPRKEEQGGFCVHSQEMDFLDYIMFPTSVKGWRGCTLWSGGLCVCLESGQVDEQLLEKKDGKHLPEITSRSGKDPIKQ